MGAEVVDASNAVMPIHQNHDYGYHPAGRTGVWSDELSRRNYKLSGSRWHLRTIDDATHVLEPDGLRTNPAQGEARGAAHVADCEGSCLDGCAGLNGAAAASDGNWQSLESRLFLPYRCSIFDSRNSVVILARL